MVKTGIRGWALLVLGLFLVQSGVVIGQTSAIHSGQTGSALIDLLQDDYYPTSPQSYNSARDAMYGTIDRKNGQVTGVYTGFTITTSTRGDAYDKGINTEHVWPQGNFNSSSPMVGDIHHLFPTRIEANSARSNYPFAEIPDNQTDTWFYLDTQSSGIPSANIDLYSESTSSAFEPREDFKGNVARAIFYFWTIYQDNASVSGSTNENFFNGMKETLYDWHKMDPVDQAEVDRSVAVENVQGNRNPFIHDTSLVRRAYFFSGGDSGNGGDDGGTEGSETTETFTNIPDNGSSYGTVNWTGDNSGSWSATDARTDQTLNGKAITVRNGILTSPEISGGIGSLTLTSQRVFSGSTGNLTVYVNDVEVGTIPYSDSEQTSSISGINETGNFVLEIHTPGTGDRIAMDDLTWTSYSIPPQITVSATSLSDFSYTENEGPSSEQSFEISGENLEAQITVTPPADFLISTQSGTGFTSSALSFSPTDGTLSTTEIFVQLAAGLSPSNYSGTIEITSANASTKEVAVSGEVAESVPEETSYTENFDNFPEYQSSYNDGNFTGVKGNTWYYVSARGDQQMDGKSPGLEDESYASLKSEISGGISGFSFDYEQLFSSDVNLNVYINGNLEATVTSNGEAGVIKNSGQIEVSYFGDFEIEFRQGNGGGQVGIDNVSWTASPGGSVQLTGQEGFRLLSAPAENQSLQTILSENGIFTQCFTGADVEDEVCESSSSVSENVFFFDHNTNGWIPATNITQTVPAGTGILVYVFEDDDPGQAGVDGGFPKTISISGKENSAGISPTINPNNDGYTLLGNPFSTAIRFSDLDKNDLAQVVYVWDPNDGTGNWKSYDATSGTGDLTGGRIAPFQGFIVKNASSVSSPSVTFGEASKSGETDFLGKENNSGNPKIRLELGGENLTNSVWMHFSEKGSAQAEVSGDALKLAPLSTQFAQVGIQKNDKLFDIAHLPETDTSYEVPLAVEATKPGFFSLKATHFSIPDAYELFFKNYEKASEERISEDFVTQIEIKKTAQKKNPLALSSLKTTSLKKDQTSGYGIVVRKKTTIQNETVSQPAEFQLLQNYPNPFNPTTVIRYQLAEGSQVSLKVFDMLGREVATLIAREKITAGMHSVTFDSANLPSGLYVYRITADGYSQSRQMMLIK